jgi:hypothetical protein
MKWYQLMDPQFQQKCPSSTLERKHITFYSHNLFNISGCTDGNMSTNLNQHYTGQIYHSSYGNTFLKE